MQAAVWTGKNTIEIKEVPVPEISEEEALIKVKCAGVCVTDYHIISGKLKIGKTPNIQGHEICGVVEKINSKNSDISVGQRCVIATSLGCGKCEFCRMGKQYLCKESGEIGYYPYNGGYAEYVKVPVSAIVPISDKISDAAGSIVESVVCPTESLMNVGVPLNATVFVTGVGPAGLAYIMLAKAMGAGKVISLVRGGKKAERARRFGADYTVDTTEVTNIEEAIKALTDGEGADMVIETTAAPNLISEAFAWCKKGGKIIQYGIPGDEDVVNYPVKELILKELTVHGAVGNTKAWIPLTELIAAGKIDLEKMVTHKFKLKDIDKAFDLYRSHNGDIIKAIIEF